MSLYDPELLMKLGLDTCIAFDVETTGLDPREDEVIQFSAVKFVNGKIHEELNLFCNPGRPVPAFITELTRIDDAMLEGQPSFAERIEEILEFLGDHPLIAHNAFFDLSFLNAELSEPLNNPIIDTLDLARIFLYHLPDRKLETLSAHFALETEGAHRADVDSRNTGHLFFALLEIMLYYDISLYKDIVYIISSLPGLYNYDLFYNILMHYENSGRNEVEKKPPYHPMPDNKMGNFKSRDSLPGTDIRRISRGDVDAIFGLKGRLSETHPGYELRIGQMQLAGDIVETFNEGEFLVAEAGTGVGKSLAYLIPAVKWMKKNRREGLSIVVSSYTKNLQEQLFLKDIPFIHDFIEEDFTVVLLKGRQNYICLTKWKWLMKNLDKALSAFDRQHLLPLLVWLRETQTGDIEENSGFQIHRIPYIWAKLCSEPGYCGTKKCSENQGCYLGKIRKLAHYADIIIVNHSLLLSDAASGNGILPDHPICIIDEAHNLPKAAYNYFGVEITPWAIERVMHKLYSSDRMQTGALLNLSRYVGKGKGWKKDNKDMIIRRISQAEDDVENLLMSSTLFFKDFLKEINRNVRDGQQRYIQKVRYKPENSPFSEMKSAQSLLQALLGLDSSLKLLRKEVDSLEAIEKASISEEMDDVLLALTSFEELQKALQICLNPEAEDWIYWYEIPTDPESININIKAVPLHVEKELHRLIYSHKYALVATSATLTVSERFKYFLKRSGLDMIDEERLKTQIYDSPFNYAEQCEIWNLTHFAEPGNRHFDEEVGKILAELSMRFQLGTLVLTTSYASIINIRTVMEPLIKHHDVQLLTQIGSASRTALLQRFIRDSSSVLIGTESFWEGVDIPGEALEILVMTKLPFSVPTEPVLQAIGEDIRNQGGNPFMEYDLPEAILKFKQGFGRLIRSRDDKGIALIMDKRLSVKHYGQYFVQSIPIDVHFVKSSEELIENIENWVKRNKNVKQRNKK